MTIAIIFSILLALGIILTAIPTLPGMLYMFLITLIYAFIDKFETIHPWHLLVFGGIVLAAILSDYVSGLVGAKVGGASKLSLFFGLFGLIVGLIIFPPFGLFIGLFLGVFFAELLQHSDHKKAFKAASYAFLATIFGMGFNILLAVGYLITFLIIVF